MFLYLNTFQIIFVGLKCEFSFSKCLRRFALFIGMEIEGQYMNRSTFNGVYI